MQTPNHSPATPGPFDDLLADPLTPPVTTTPAPDAPSPLPPEPPPPATTTTSITATGSMADPFADVLGAPITQQLAQAPTPPPGPAQARIPDDFDPMALKAVSARNTDDPLAALDSADTDLNAMFTQPSVDAIYAPSGVSIAPMLEDPLDAGHGQLMELDSTLDPLLLFAGHDQAAESLLHSTPLTPAPPAVHNHTPERSAFFRAPQATPVAGPQPEPEPDPLSALATPGPAPADARQLLDAFARGAGLDHALAGTLNPDVMHALGRILAASVQHHLRLMQEIPAAAPALERLAALSHAKIQQSVTFVLDKA